MAKRLAYLVVSGSVLAVIATPASACSVIVTRQPYVAELRREARQTVERSTAIYDGIVVEAATNDQPAKVKVMRVFKGPTLDFVKVGSFDSCDISFDRVGERWRFVLFGGPDVYSTWVDYSNARQIDQILGSNRRKDWPLNRFAN